MSFGQLSQLARFLHRKAKRLFAFFVKMADVLSSLRLYNINKKCLFSMSEVDEKGDQIQTGFTTDIVLTSSSGTVNDDITNL